jgi:hypothetical protein
MLSFALIGLVLHSRLVGPQWFLPIGLASIVCGSVFVVCIIFRAGSVDDKISAGSGWFAIDDGFVRTDRLSVLRVRVILSGTYVSLKDIEGRHLDIPLSKLTANSKIWQVVLDGVSESVAGGLVVDDDLTAGVFEVGGWRRVANAALPIGEFCISGSRSESVARNRAESSSLCEEGAWLP